MQQWLIPQGNRWSLAENVNGSLRPDRPVVESMNKPPGKGAPSLSRPVLVVILLSALVGGITGFGTGFLSAQRPSAQAPQIREFYLFTDSIPFNQTKVGVSHDIYSPSRFLVNKGDTVIIRYYNLEDLPSNHSFTMEAPYQMNYILHINENATIQFVANTPGIFAYRCIFHQPTMTGYIAIVG
jgi:plastocyanin